MSATAVEHAEGHDPAGPTASQRERAGSVGKLGMWVFLISDSFSFGGLLLAYAILRYRAAAWPDPALGEPALGVGLAAGLTGALVASSVTMALARAAAVRGQRGKLCALLALTILGGLIFLCGQGYEYRGLLEAGLALGGSPYASTFYVITGFHGLHVLAGVIYLTVTLIQAARGRYDRGNHGPVEIAGLFWQFVDLVWIVVFTCVYLL